MHLLTFYSVIVIYVGVQVVLNRIMTMLAVHDTAAFGENLAKAIETTTVVKHLKG